MITHHDVSMLEFEVMSYEGVTASYEITDAEHARPWSKPVGKAR